MAQTKTLVITGFEGLPVPNRLLRPERAIDRLAVLLPGFGYTLDMPLFYYAENLLLERGWDVLRVEYAYNRLPGDASGWRVLLGERLLADAAAAWRAGRAQGAYSEVVFVGKSLGTQAMGHLLTAPDPPQRMRAVWLTPLLSIARLREQIAAFGGPSLFVIGTADEEYDAEALDALIAATGGEAVVVAGADHGMDIPGDPIASIRAMDQFVAALGRFL